MEERKSGERKPSLFAKISVKIVRMKNAVFAFCFLILPISTAVAIPRNPPPIFESDYVLPTTSTPMPTCSVATENWLAVILYGAFLFLAVHGAFTWRSRRGLFLLAVASVVVLGFLMNGCPCPVGMFQNIVDAFVQPTTLLPWTVLILFTVPLLIALFFGRVFCSGVCPFGAVQELTAVKPIKIPDGLEHALGLFRYVCLGLGVFCVTTELGYVICRFDPYVGFFRRSGLYPVLVFGGIILGLGFFVGRPFCRFLCPYGALLGLCGSLTKKKVSITPGDCTNCRLCEEICPYNAILPPTAPLSAVERKLGPKRLLTALVALPILVGCFAILGHRVGPMFAPWNRDVRLAELLYAEEMKIVDSFGNFPETRTILQTGTPYGEVYRQALLRIETFRTAGLWFGVWIGTVIGLKFIFLVLRRRRTDYEVDPARCVACGRCFWYCPNQKEFRVLLEPEKSRNTD